MGIFKKRTPAEVAKSRQDKDYTGGYSFLPWLIHADGSSYLLGFIVNLVLGLAVIFSTWGDVASLIGMFFAFIVAPFIAFLTIRSYRRRKKGITS